MSETTAPEATERPADVSPPADVTPVWKLARRDGGIALLALSAFAAADAWYATTGLVLAAGLGVLNGVAAGILLSNLSHEWGHFAGARWSGGIAPTRSLKSFFPIFDFDLQRSDPQAFRAMSVGGNLGHWALVLVLVLVLPLDNPGRAALVAAAFGGAIAASTTEFPIIQRAFSGATPAESFRGLTADTLRRDRWIGGAAGLALFVVL